MPLGRISKRSVEALVCAVGKDREFLWDDSLAGFGVTAFPSGKKTYVVQYRNGGCSRRTTIGNHGRLTPNEARSEAKKLLGSVEKGEDPVAAKKARRAVRTFKEIADEFLASHVKEKRKARTHESYEILLRRHINPAIGNMRVTEVRRADVARMHARMADRPGAANRALSLVSAIWNWGTARNEVLYVDNPARGVERNREQAKERFLSTEEFKRLGETLTRAETFGLDYGVDELKTGSEARPKA